MNNEELKNFFQAYSDAFNEQDVNRIADLYAFPAEIVSEGKTYKFKDRGAFLDNLYRVLEIYRRIGVNNVVFRLDEAETNRKVALVHWTMLNEANRTIIGFKTRYHFLRSGQRINCVEVFDEPEKLRKLLGSP